LEPQGADRIGPQDADAAGRESHQDALRRRRWKRAHAGRGRTELRRHPRTYPADRSEGAAQAAPSVPQPKTARIPGGTHKLEKVKGQSATGKWGNFEFSTLHFELSSPGAHSSTVRAAGS